MAPVVLQAFAVILAVSGSLVVGQRPTNDEWKKKRAEEDAAAASAKADQGKMAAVDKVVTMLDDLQKQVLAAGEQEAATYNTFACFCKDGQRDKNKAITEGKDRQKSLSTSIDKLAMQRKKEDKLMWEKKRGLEDQIKQLGEDMTDENADHAKQVSKYEEDAADLSFAIESIGSAMKTLKASKPSLLQFRSASDGLQQALAMADALGLGTSTQSVAALLQQAPDVEMENYKFHSGGVIDTLEKLQGEFRGKKNKLDADEVERTAKHDMLIQQLTDKQKSKEVELANTHDSYVNHMEEIQDKSQQLTTVSSTLLDDQLYLKELYAMCSKRAETWDVRIKVRADELSAITAAITIVKGAVSEKTSKSTLRLVQRGVSVPVAKALARDADAMDVLEAAAEERDQLATHPSLYFLQRQAVNRHGNPEGEAMLKIVDFLRSRKSAILTSLASTIQTQKPKGMEKIKTLIEELIKRLMAEAANEATQKGWCDKNMGAANTKKMSAGAAITELNDSLAALHADITLLAEELQQLADDIEALNDAQDKADKIRKEESAENDNTVKEAKWGKVAVEEAIDILQKFYKEAADAEVALVQHSGKGPADDAPDAGFEGGEAYKGSQSSAGGVLGMLDIIKSDFDRTIKETQQAEEESEQDYKAFTQTTQTSLKEKTASEKARKKEKSVLDQNYEDDKTKLEKKTDLLVNTIEELLELKGACVDTAMSYEERVARREDEIASLRKALCILTKFAENGGNDGPYDQCS